MKRTLCLLLLAGCGQSESFTDASATPDLGPIADLYFNPYADLAGSDLTFVQKDFAGTTVDIATPDLAGGGLQALNIGPITLGAGEERTVCRTFLLPSNVDIDVTDINATLAPGSHHLILYKSKANAEKDLYDCQPLDIGGGDVPLYIAETQNDNDLPLPTGVAYQIPAHQMMRLEAHYLNASQQQITGMGTVNLTVGPAGNYQPADIMFCGSVTSLTQGIGKGVPPGDTTLPAGFYQPPNGVQVFGLTTHEHKRGSLMVVDKSTGTQAGTNLTMGQPYDNPPFIKYDDAHLLSFGQGEGFRWDCSYHNTSQMTYYFGQSAQDNEMCFFWAYYFPSAGHFISSECWR
jgi:hypothetical protein